MQLRKIVCLYFVLLVAGIAYAEENAANGGNITGEIRDIKQNPIIGVEVKIVSSDGETFTVISDADGNYKFSNIPAGRYIGNYHKKGYGSRTGTAIVVDNGRNHVVQHIMHSTKDIQQIQLLVHHVTDNIEVLFDLDALEVKALRQSMHISLENVLEHDQNLMSMVLSSRHRNGAKILDALLTHSETKNTIAKHLNTQQLKDYIDFTKTRQKNAQQACIHFIAVLLEQSLSLSIEQKDRVIQLLIESKDADKQLTLENLISEPLQNIVNLINNKLKLSLDNILNQTQSELWKVMLQIYEEDRHEFGDVVGIEVLEAPMDEAIEKPETQKKQLQVKSKEEIRESLLLQLAKTALTAHTERLGIQNEQDLRRLDLAAAGVAHQFVETQDIYINLRAPFVEDLSNIIMSVMASSITREDAIKKLNTIAQDLQEKKTNNQEIVDVSDKTVNPLYHHTLNNTFFDRISYILNHPLYQQAIKDVLPEEAYTQYIEKETERIAFLQQASRELVVANIDIYLLLNENQRKHLETVAAQLTLPIISNDGLTYMMIKLFLSVATETWSPWQQLQVVNGG